MSPVLVLAHRVVLRLAAEVQHVGVIVGYWAKPYDALSDSRVWRPRAYRHRAIILSINHGPEDGERLAGLDLLARTSDQLAARQLGEVECSVDHGTLVGDHPLDDDVVEPTHPFYRRCPLCLAAL